MAPSAGTLSKKKEKERKKKACGDLGRARRWGGRRRTPSIHPVLCLRWADTAESLDSVGSPVVPVKSDNAVSDLRHGSGRRRHAGKLFGRRKKGRRRSQKPGEASNSSSLPPSSRHPSPLVGISFKCQTVHLERLTQTSGGLADRGKRGCRGVEDSGRMSESGTAEIERERDSRRS